MMGKDEIIAKLAHDAYWGKGVPIPSHRNTEKLLVKNAIKLSDRNTEKLLVKNAIKLSDPRTNLSKLADRLFPSFFAILLRTRRLVINIKGPNSNA